jgi:hypothetical protein
MTLSTKDRLEFSLSKVASAMKWMTLSGTATFFLTGLLAVTTEIELPRWGVLLMVLVINTLLFGIAKFKEGGEEVSRG